MLCPNARVCSDSCRLLPLCEMPVWILLPDCCLFCRSVDKVTDAFAPTVDMAKQKYTVVHDTIVVSLVLTRLGLAT